MKLDELEKLLIKYGFASSKKEPFLYANQENGICYTFKDPFYGLLTRVIFPKSIEETEEFLKKLLYYKKNGAKEKIRLQLSNYEILDPTIALVQDNKEKTIAELEEKRKEEASKEKKENPSSDAYLSKLKRTLLLLIEIVREKIKIQNITYENLMNLTNNYIENENKLEGYLSKLEKREPKVTEKIPTTNTLETYEQDLAKWITEAKSLNKEAVLEDYIQKLTYFLYHLESDEGLLKNKYEMVKIPLQTDIVKEKLAFLESIQDKKKLWSKKEKIYEELEKIEAKSSLSKIVNFEHYKENEQKRLEEKYAVLPDLDIRTIGDYFREFDNLKIEEPVLEERPVMEVEKKREENPSFEETMTHLENEFESLPKKDQEKLIAYQFIMKNIFNGTKEEIKKNIEDFQSLLANPNNIMIKVKYFKQIDVTSNEACLSSMKTLLEEISELKMSTLIGDINVFWKDFNEANVNKVLKVSTKRLLAPIQKINACEVMYLGTIKKGTNVLFIPSEIVREDETLTLKPNRPFFFVDVQKNELQLEISDIIKVTNYEVSSKEENHMTVVTELKNQKDSFYKTVTIERKAQ